MAHAVSDRLRFAVAVAREAGALAQQIRQDLGTITSKDPLDFCTEGDRAVEAMVRSRVAKQYNEPVLGEEDGGEPAARLWVVDPIDGTSNYIQGSPRWCVSLAYVADGRVQLGVIAAPVEQRLFMAEHGAGAFLNDAPIRVSGLRTGTAPIIEAGWSTRRPIESYSVLIQRLIAGRMEFRRHGSGALGMADVAAGLNDGYVELHINAWDVLAGIVLVQEAGGWVSDYLANDGIRKGNPIIACTPEIGGRLQDAMTI